MKVCCNGCGAVYMKDDLQRQCSNCFACTGCEIYICVECDDEIVVRPIGSRKQRKPEGSPYGEGKTD